MRRLSVRTRRGALKFLFMNYTRPNDANHVDDPKEWLNSALLFGRALSLLLKKNEGVVTSIVGDAFNPVADQNKVIVYFDGKMINVTECEEDLEEGQMVWVD